MLLLLLLLLLLPICGKVNDETHVGTSLPNEEMLEHQNTTTTVSLLQGGVSLSTLKIELKNKKKNFFLQ